MSSSITLEQVGLGVRGFACTRCQFGSSGEVCKCEWLRSGACIHIDVYTVAVCICKVCMSLVGLYICQFSVIVGMDGIVLLFRWGRRSAGQWKFSAWWC